MVKPKNGGLQRLLKMLDTLSSKRVALIFAVIGFITFIVCLNNPFQGDDITQIVENLPVHFIQNIGYFFTDFNSVCFFSFFVLWRLLFTLISIYWRYVLSLPVSF